MACCSKQHNYFIVASRPDVNAKFYGKSCTAQELLFEDIPRPIAAQPLYQALNDAMNSNVRKRGSESDRIL